MAAGVEFLWEWSAGFRFARMGWVMGMQHWLVSQPAKACERALA